MTQAWPAQKRLNAKTTSWNDSPARLAAFGLRFFIQQFPCGQLLFAVVFDDVEQVPPQFPGPTPVPAFGRELAQGTRQHGQGIGPARRADLPKAEAAAAPANQQAAVDARIGWLFSEGPPAAGAG